MSERLSSAAPGALAPGPDHPAALAITVVVLTAERPDEAAACLDSCYAQGYPGLAVVVVDNGSPGRVGDRLAARCPSATVLRSDEPLGFAAGCNLGLRRALADGCDAALLLNDDARLEPGALAALAAVLARRPEVGIVGPKIVYDAAPDRIWFAGARRHPLAFLAVDTGEGEPDGPRFDRPRPVDFVCGCALLARRAVWERVGLLDERFFFYYEDSDLCERARRAGFVLWYEPRARVRHRVPLAGAGWDTSPWKVYARAHASARFFRKHLRGPHLAVVVASRLAVGLLLARRAGRPGLLVPHLRGLYDGLRAGEADRLTRDQLARWR